MDNGIDIVLEEEELEVEVQEDFLKGDKGDPGYAPVRGIDYYTEQDKQELIDELTEDIQGVKNDFNTNVVSKTTEFNNNATNKMAEFNANTITKINEYNENAKDLINRVIEAEAENERLREDLNGLPTEETSGENIDITDSVEMRFSKFNISGNSIQEGTPTPDTPVDVESCGDNVNLFEQCNGIWYDTNSYKYIDNATVYGFMAKVKPNTTYTISKKNQGNRFIITAGSQPVKTGNSLTRIVFASNHTITNYTFTTQENESYVFLGVHNGTNASEIALAVEETKIVEGTNTGAYSPYGQGSINEVICNKNLLVNNINTITTAGVTITRNNDGSLTFNGTSTANRRINFSEDNLNLKQGAYTWSTHSSGSVDKTVYMSYTVNDTDILSFTISATNTKTITINENVSGIASIYFGTGRTFDNFTIYPMLQQGAEETDYVEHKSQAFTIPTQQQMRSIGDVRDTFVKVNGKWYERHNVNRYEFTGTENWKHNNGTKFVYVELSDIKVSNKDILAISNSFKGITQEEMLVLTNDNSISGWNDNSLIVIRALEIVTEKEQLENFKTWLQTQYNAGTPVYVDYILAEPTDIECTEEQSIILDEIENTAKTYEGITHIYSTDTVSPIIDVTYFRSLSDIKIEEVYSTEEQVIGTWINGKPLYRKILQYSLSSGNATDKFNISELSIATTTKLEGIALNNGYARQVGYVYGNATTTLGEMAGMYLSTNFTILNVTHAGTNLGTLYVTIEYTKTTD